jgi:hypothetical protein
MSADAGRADRLDVAVIPRSLSGFAAAEAGAEQIRDEIGRLVAAGGTVLVANLPAAGFVDAVQWLANEVVGDI